MTLDEAIAGPTRRKGRRPIRIEGDIAYVPLTQGYEAIIDAEDVPKVSGWNWHVSMEKHRMGSAHSYAKRSAVDANGKHKSVFMHRVIANTPDGMNTDHIDGDGLNNRKCNLRVASIAQNAHNRRVCVRNSSGFKGVSWDAYSGKWRAQIMVNKKRVHIGYYRSPEEGAAAYKVASAQFHSSFGRTA